MLVNGLKSIRAVSPELYAAFDTTASRFEDFEECDQHGVSCCEMRPYVIWLHQSNLRSLAVI